MTLTTEQQYAIVAAHVRADYQYPGADGEQDLDPVECVTIKQIQNGDLDEFGAQDGDWEICDECSREIVRIDEGGTVNQIYQITA